MWQARGFATRKRPVETGYLLDTGFSGTELRVDGRQLSNAIELVCWSSDPVQLIVCETCWFPGCFFFDRRPGFTEWRPLVIMDGQARLLLEPGYIVEWERDPDRV